MSDMLPMYDTETFAQILPDFDSFKKLFDEEYDQYAKDCITSPSLNKLYWLLYARYADNPIVNRSVERFKAKLVAITFQKAPTWEKKLGVQSTLRGLTEAELQTGARTIFNRALHPETEPGTDTDTELSYINTQDVSKQKRSKLDAYSYLMDVLRTDVTEELIQSYAKLFTKFVSPNVTRIYENIISEEEEEEVNG